jgi:hypothetical protein
LPKNGIFFKKRRNYFEKLQLPEMKKKKLVKKCEGPAFGFR